MHEKSLLEQHWEALLQTPIPATGMKASTEFWLHAVTQSVSVSHIVLEASSVCPSSAGGPWSGRLKAEELSIES